MASCNGRMALRLAMNESGSLLVIIQAEHVQKCRAMQIGGCMHTIHFYTLHSMNTRLLRTVVKHRVAPHTVSSVYSTCNLPCAALPFHDYHWMRLHHSEVSTNRLSCSQICVKDDLFLISMINRYIQKL